MAESSATIGNLLIGLGFKTAASSISKVESDANAVKNSLSKILGAIGITLTLNGVKNFIQETSAAYADFKATATQFQNTFDGIAEQAQASLEKVSQATGISSNRIKATYSSMGSFAKTSGMDVQQANEFTAKAMQEIADNAAYMDVSVEEAAETFTRLLKGNFQVDDKMNFNFTESQRDALAQEMYGAKFSALEDVQKFEVIYEKLRRANISMGAVKVDENGNVTYRQAAAEAGEYTNQVGELSDAMQLLKVNVGGIFLQPLLTVQTKLAEVMHKLANILGDVNDESSYAYKISQRVNRVVQKAIDYFDKGVRTLKALNRILGGTSQSLEIIKVAIGGIAGYLALSGTISTLSKINWKLVGILAIILLIAGAIQDVVFFFQGKNSLLGDMLEAAGLDKEAVRQGGIQSLADLKEAFMDLANSCVEFYTENKEEIDALISGLGTLLLYLGKLLVILGAISFSGIVGFFSDVAEAISEVVDGAKALIDLLKTGDWHSFMMSYWGIIGDNNDYVMSGKSTLSKAAGTIDSIFGTNFSQNVLDTRQGINNFMADNPIRSFWGWLTKSESSDRANLSDTKEGREEIDAQRKALGQDAIDWDAYDESTKSSEKSTKKSSNFAAYDHLAPMVEDNENQLGFDWKKSAEDATDSFTSGFDFSAAMEKEDEFTQYTADNLKHSTPVAGPMSGDDTWMPDMMQNFIDGINNKKSEFEAAVLSLAAIVNDNLGGVMELSSGSTSVVGRNTNRNTTVTQNISFSNTFNGDTRSNQVAAGNAMRNNANDTTTYLANGLAFGS